jgi:uncharacterized protein
MPSSTGLQLLGGLAAACLLAGPVAAQEGVDRLFPATPTGYLTDVADVVDPASAARIEGIAKTLRERTGAELSIVTLPTVGQYEASDVALAIGRRWGVGAKADVGSPIRNAGMVILLVPRTGDQVGKIRLEVGQGLEGIIPDAMAGRIRDAMRSQLAQGQYGPGLVTGVEAVASVVAQSLGIRDSTLTPVRSVGRTGARSSLFFLLLVFAVIAIMMAMASARSSRAIRGRGGRRPRVYWGPGPWIGGGGWGGGGFGSSGGGGFGGFGGGGGFSGGGAGGDF